MAHPDEIPAHNWKTNTGCDEGSQAHNQSMDGQVAQEHKYETPKR